MRTIIEITKEVNKIEKKLIRAKVRENFGQKELRALEDYIGFIGDYPINERECIQDRLNDIRTYCENKSY
jgi:hypothetical protein